VTLRVDTTAKLIWARVDSLSPFELTEPTTPPTVTHSVPVYSSKLTKVTITATDIGGSGVRQIEYKINGALKPHVAGSSAPVSFTRLGDNELQYRAVDNAGNSSDWKWATIRVKYTSLTFTAPTTCPYRSAKLSGYLTYADAAGAMKPLRGGHVSVQQYISGVWKEITRPTTDETGRWSYTATPTKKASYRVVYAGTATYLKQTAGPKSVLPKVYLSAPAFRKTTTGSSSTSLKYGSTYVVNGYLKPKHASGSTQVKVKAYRYERGKWVYKKTYTATASNYSTYSRYNAKIKLPSKGTWRVRAYHAADAANASTYSSYRKVSVK
jgi:hypothetical protein